MRDHCFFPMPELETPRLLLRRLVRSDTDDLFAYARDPEVARHVLWEAHQTRADSRWYIRQQRRCYRDGEPASLAMELKESGRMIGTIGWMEYAPEHNLAEIGYSLSREYWNRGLMTEAVMAVTDYSFREMGLHRLQAMVETDNPASARVLVKCGYRQEGLLRGRVCNKGHYSDVLLFALLREELLR